MNGFREKALRTDGRTIERPRAKFIVLLNSSTNQLSYTNQISTKIMKNLTYLTRNLHFRHLKIQVWGEGGQMVGQKG